MKKDEKRLESGELVWYYDEDNFPYQAEVLATQDYSSGANWYYVILVGGKVGSSEPFTTQSHRVFRTLQENDCDRLIELARKAAIAIERFVELAKKTNAFNIPAAEPPTKEVAQLITESMDMDIKWEGNEAFWGDFRLGVFAIQWKRGKPVAFQYGIVLGLGDGWNVSGGAATKEEAIKACESALKRIILGERE